MRIECRLEHGFLAEPARKHGACASRVVRDAPHELAHRLCVAWLELRLVGTPAPRGLPASLQSEPDADECQCRSVLLLRFDEAGHDEHAGRLEHVRRWQRLRNGLDSHLTRRRQPANLSAYVRPRNARREQMLDLPPSLDSTRLEQRRRILFVQVRSYLAQVRSDSSTWRSHSAVASCPSRVENLTDQFARWSTP